MYMMYVVEVSLDNAKEDNAYLKKDTDGHTFKLIITPIMNYLPRNKLNVKF